MNSDLRRRYMATLEDIAVSWVIAALQEEGRVIADAWRPDRELARRSDLRRRPDCVLTIDDRPAAVEVTLFTSKVEAAAGARVADIRRVAEETAWADRPPDGLSLLSHLTYYPGRLRATSRRTGLEDAERIGHHLADYARHSGEATAVRLELRGLPRWVRSVAVTTTKLLRPP